MTTLSFTRNFEDVMINRALRSIPIGTYIDVGAYRPIADSNTFALYQRGWRGIAVEPQTKLQALWPEQRPEDVLIKGAVGASSGEITFHEFPWNDQAATISEDIVAMHQREGREVVSHTVPQYTLSELIDTHLPQRDIHLLSIDVEGAEKQVLQGLDRTRHRPWLVVLESVLPNRPQTNFAEWEPLLLASDYEFVYFDAVNRFYLAHEHAALRPHFSYPPCVWDDFVDYRLVNAQNQAANARKELEDLKAKLRELAG